MSHTFLGPRGAMVPVKCPSGLRPLVSRESTERVTLGGVRRVHRAPRTIRSWDVSIDVSNVAGLAGLAALLEASAPPWLWVDPWSQVTNLMTGPVSMLAAETLPAGVSPGGPIPLDDGTSSLSSAINGSTANFTLGRASGVPVLPGTPVTASAFVRSTGTTPRFISLWWLNIAGTVTAGPAAAFPDDPVSPLRRVSVTATPPVGAVAAQIRFAGVAQVANPAITWTTGPVDWFPGQGVNGVEVSGLDMGVIMAVADPSSAQRYASASFTVTEVG